MKKNILLIAAAGLVLAGCQLGGPKDTHLVIADDYEPYEVTNKGEKLSDEDGMAAFYDMLDNADKYEAKLEEITDVAAFLEEKQTFGEETATINNLLKWNSKDLAMSLDVTQTIEGDPAYSGWVNDTITMWVDGDTIYQAEEGAMEQGEESAEVKGYVFEEYDASEDGFISLDYAYYYLDAIIEYWDSAEGFFDEETFNPAGVTAEFYSTGNEGDLYMHLDINDEDMGVYEIELQTVGYLPVYEHLYVDMGMPGYAMNMEYNYRWIYNQNVKVDIPDITAEGWEDLNEQYE